MDLQWKIIGLHLFMKKKTRLKNMHDIVPHMLYQHSLQSTLVFPSNIG